MAFYHRFRIPSAILCVLWGVAGVVLADSGPRSPVNCNIQQGACAQRLEGHRITLDVGPRPVRAMTELTFTVTLEGPHPARAGHIELNMLAMDMGKNHVPLKLTPNGQYQGRGVIVRCRTGIRTWSAKVVFPGLGTTEFIFDVIY